MFKAPLIENERYYRLRSKQFILTLLLSLFVGLLVIMYSVPPWLAITVILSYIAGMVLMCLNQKKLNGMLGKRLIEMDDQQIRVKSEKGSPLRVFDLSTVERIWVKEDYFKPQETIDDLGQEILGSSVRNYLIIEQDGLDCRLDFEIDSHYMIIQLRKSIKVWGERGCNVALVGQE